MTRRRWIVGAVVVLAGAGFGWLRLSDQTPPGTVFRTTEPYGSGQTLSIALGDETGLVTSIEPERYGDASGALAVPEGPNAVLVTWSIRGCDVGTNLAFDRSATGYRLGIRLDHGIRINGCSDLYTFAGVRITFRQPISSDVISLEGDTSRWP